jgi:hypothetical protein
MGRIVVVAALLLGAPAPGARADTQVLDVDTQLSVRSAPKGDDVDCGVHAGGCDVYYAGEVVYSGSWEGHGRFVVRSTLIDVFASGGDWSYEGWATFTGVVHGCGRGTMRIALHRAVVAPRTPPAVGYEGGDEWELIPGESTGDLAALTAGSGTGSLRSEEPALVSHYDGRRTGTLRCER